MLRHRRRSRRKRFLGPLGVGLVVLIGIVAIVAGNSAAPPKTVAGGVAGATDVVVPNGSAAAALARPVATPAATPTAPTPSPVASAPAPAVLTGYRWPLPHGPAHPPVRPDAMGRLGGRTARSSTTASISRPSAATRIVAAHDGVVLAAGRHYDDQMGWIGDLSKYYARLDAKKLWVTLPIVVVIDDGNGYRSVYAHFGKVVVKKGQTRQRRRSCSGYEGATGRATGCHLHYGLFSPAGRPGSRWRSSRGAAKRMKLPADEIARVDPLLGAPAATGRPTPKPAVS